MSIDHSSAAHRLSVNFQGETVVFIFAAVGAIAHTVTLWPDGHGAVGYSSVESARNHYRRLLESGAHKMAPTRILAGVSGCHSGYRPFVEVDGARYYGDRERRAEEISNARYAA